MVAPWPRELGLAFAAVGAAVTVKQLEQVTAEEPSAFRTVKLRGPVTAAVLLRVAVICVELTTTTFETVMSLLKLTVGPERNPVPEIVTLRPDAPWPMVFGSTPLTVGNGFTVKQPTHEDEPPSLELVTMTLRAPAVAPEDTLIDKVICVALSTVVVLTVIPVPENVTDVPLGKLKPVPVITTV